MKYLIKILSKKNEDNKINNNADGSFLKEEEIEKLYKQFEKNGRKTSNSGLTKFKTDSRLTFSSPPKSLFKKPKKIINTTTSFGKVLRKK